MIRPRLLAWQWSDYAAKHTNRANLLLHVPAVVLAQAGMLVLVYAAIARSPAAAGVAAACIVVSLAAQGRGHRLEREAPTPFSGAGDFVTRFVVEQWITFPRFVLSGGWLRALRRP